MIRTLQDEMAMSFQKSLKFLEIRIRFRRREHQPAYRPSANDVSALEGRTSTVARNLRRILETRVVFRPHRKI